MKSMHRLAMVCAVVSAFVFLNGCSEDRVAGPASSGLTDMVNLAATVGDPIQFAARVETIDYGQNMLTFYGVSYTVFAATDCEIVRVLQGEAVPILFTDIAENDSLQVCGALLEDGTVLANRLRLYGDGDCITYDLAFRDTIVSIEYGAGTFMVAGRSETIVVDENTVIWATIYGRIDPHTTTTIGNQSMSKAEPDFPGGMSSRDTILSVSDLKVGDVVEVRADITDPSTLLAIKIKLVNCPNKICEEFLAYIATIDCEQSTVTFEGYDWIGSVCPGAELLGPGGEELTLCDFSAGDYVAVKGFPLEGDALKICRLVMENP